MNLTFAYTLAGMHIFLRTACRVFPDRIVLGKIKKKRLGAARPAFARFIFASCGEKRRT